MKSIVVFCLLLLLVSACTTPLQVPDTPIIPLPTTMPYPAETLMPSSEPTGTAVIVPTATNFQLPHILVQERSEYCQSPFAALSIRDAEGLSEDQIARKLVEIWLDRYKNPKAHPYCRIDDYRVDDIYSNPKIGASPVQPKGDIMRVVKFSVKLIQVPTDWLAFSGEIDTENWLTVLWDISISKIDDNYEMVFAYP